MTGPFLKEFALRVGPDPNAVVGALAAEGWLVGPIVPDGPAAGAVLVATTERRTAAQVEGLADALDRVMRERAAKPSDAPDPQPGGELRMEVA